MAPTKYLADIRKQEDTVAAATGSSIGPTQSVLVFRGQGGRVGGEDIAPTPNAEAPGVFGGQGRRVVGEGIAPTTNTEAGQGRRVDGEGIAPTTNAEAPGEGELLDGDYSVPITDSGKAPGMAEGSSQEVKVIKHVDNDMVIKGTSGGNENSGESQVVGGVDVCDFRGVIEANTSGNFNAGAQKVDGVHVSNGVNANIQANTGNNRNTGKGKQEIGGIKVSGRSGWNNIGMGIIAYALLFSCFVLCIFYIYSLL